MDAWSGPGRIGHVASRDEYFLEELNLGNTDTSFWTMTKQEVEAMDPQQGLMLEVVRGVAESERSERVRFVWHADLPQQL